MERNALKVKILPLLESSTRTSHEVDLILRETANVRLSHRAVEMALLRYWRQGLLRRERKGRRFAYLLTERGRARMEWLLKNK